MNNTGNIAPPQDASPTAMARVTGASDTIDFIDDEHCRSLVARLVRVMYPHDRFGDGPYARSAEAILRAASVTPALKAGFVKALHDLEEAGFARLDMAAAEQHLRTIQETSFFRLARSTAIVTLYDDPEVWNLLGYEGPSFHKGGYLHRGFNDLDWLPEPRIDELGAHR